MKWTTKARAFRVLSAVPMGASLHFVLQRFFTREWPRTVSAIEELWKAGQKVLDLYRTHGGLINGGTTFVEVGAGRDLSVAIALRLLGVERVVSFDVDRLARLPFVRQAMTTLGGLAGRPVPEIHGWQELADWGVDYRAPGRFEVADLQPSSVDCFFSIDTLEHVPLAELTSLMRHGRAVLKTSGLSIHLVDYSDHFARGDPSITRFNFLRFTAAEWSRYNTRLHYVNRLRHPDYLQLLVECAMRTLAVEAVDAAAPAEIAEHLAADFSHYSERDLFVARAWLVAKPE